jgi:Secretion system C-terminal sorting domain/3-keto-disaccharide hydrolase
MNRLFMILQLLLLATFAIAQPLPAPENLQATLNEEDGIVALSWEYHVLTPGYFNDFDTDDLTGWEIDNDENWWVDTQTGILHTDWLPQAAWQWSSMAYTACEYTNATLTARMRRTAGSLNYAQSIFIHGAGPFEPPAWNGFMVQIEVDPQSQFTVIRVTDGSTSFVTPGWEPSEFINDGFNAWNELSVEVIDGIFTLSINGGEVFTWEDQTLLSGTFSMGGVGPVGESQGMEFDYVSLEPLGVVDDFQTFNVYRDGVIIGNTTQLSFDDPLPDYGSYTYRVRAQWDEGESASSNPAFVDWNDPMFYLVPIVTLVPSEGGNIVYDIHANLPNVNPLTGVGYSNRVTLPDGSIVVVNNVTVNLPPFFQVVYTGQALNVPEYAPDGDYLFSAYLGFNPSPLVSDSFTFSKGWDGPDAINSVNDWHMSNDSFSQLAWSADETATLTLPEKFSLEPVYPNPFNAQANVTVQLPEAGELNVAVYNTLGQQVIEMVSGHVNAGNHTFTLDAANLSSGIYFVRAEMDGQVQTQKIVLMK